MADVKWIKITTDIFDNEKIKLIDTMPDRDALLVVWFKLLTIAGKKNDNGLVYIFKDIPTTDEMLSTIFNRQINTVRLALKTFEQFGMIEVNEHINIVNWEQHQNVQGLDKIRLQNAERQKKHREKQKQLNNSNVTVTQRNATDKIRIDKNRIDKSKDETKVSPPKKKTIEERVHDFKLEVDKVALSMNPRPTSGQIIKFTDYWSEHGEKDKKFRKEKETSFSITRRLKTWIERDRQYKVKYNQPKPQTKLFDNDKWKDEE